MYYRSAAQNSSATYEVFDKDGKLITTRSNEEFYEFSSMESKGNFIFESKLMQKVNARDTDRFKFVVHRSAITFNPELQNIETKISCLSREK